jgi:hypothetical protein
LVRGAKSDGAPLMPKLRHVKQLHGTGCGAACVAIIARVSYSEALEVMFPDQKRGFYSTYSDIRRSLVQFGVASEPIARRCTRFQRIAHLAVVGCRYRAVTETWHWIVYDPEGWTLFDPIRDEAITTTRMSLDLRYRPFSRMYVFR